MIEVIKEFQGHKFMKSFESVEHTDFLGLMKISSVLVGNSSAGIIEAPSFHLPAVNIGSRQIGRERADNIIDVGHNKIDITRAIERAFEKEFITITDNCENPYGDGMTSARIIKILTDITIDRQLLNKKWKFGGH